MRKTRSVTFLQVHENVRAGCDIYVIMKYVYPHGNSLFQNDNTLIYREKGLTEWLLSTIIIKT